MYRMLRLMAALAIIVTATHMFSPDSLAAENRTSPLNSDTIFHLINDYRLQVGLPTFVKNQWLCDLAQSRKSELYGEIFEGKGIHRGFLARKLPYWVTENMKWGSSEEEVVSWWLNSPVHRKALYSDHTYSCGVCEGHVCIELFTDFQRKES